MESSPAEGWSLAPPAVADILTEEKSIHAAVHKPLLIQVFNVS